MAADPPRYVLGRDELAAIRTPVTFIWGEDDQRYQPLDEGRTAAAAIPSAAFNVVRGGHAPWLDDVDSCSDLIISSQTGRSQSRGLTVG